jgi:hypothetical protein
MDIEQKPKKGWRHDLFRLGILLVLAIVTVIIANVLVTVFGVQ